MSRSCPYRREISEACNWHQSQALEANIFILSQTGPTGFLLKEDGETKNFKVFLGDVHNCTCPVFKKEKDLCKHICWVLLKKFRVSRTDSLTWQLGLCEREINQVIKGEAVALQQQRDEARKAHLKNKTNPASTDSPVELEQRPITEDDICPICQDELLAKKLPVTHCKFGCGNNVHIKCMKVWADHQKTTANDSKLTCPLCREQFSTFEMLDQEYRNNLLFKAEKQDLHYGLSCRSCHSSPISGKCYKCNTCCELYLCQACFNTDFHREHEFVFREKVTQKYHRASREHAGGPIPLAVGNALASRELREEDYDLLLQLDANRSGQTGYSQIPEKVIKSWPSEKVRDNSQLLGPGFQCRICLRAYQVGQMVRKLPSCKHKFHMNCIDSWLLHSHPTCPIDGQIVWDPVAEQMEKEEKKRLEQQQQLQVNVQRPNLRMNQGDLGSLGLIINFKHCLVESKPVKSKVEISSSLLATRPPQKPISRGQINAANSSNDLSINTNNNEANINILEDSVKLLSIRKSIKPLLKAQLEKNRTPNISQKRSPQIEVTGSQFTHQQLLEQASLSNSQLSSYSSKNRGLKTAQPSRSNANKQQNSSSKGKSVQNLNDGIFLRRKNSLNEHSSSSVGGSSSVLLIPPKSSYQLSRITAKTTNGSPLIRPQTSDFDKDTYDSVEITNQSFAENRDLIEANNNNTIYHNNTDMPQAISNQVITSNIDFVPASSYNDNNIISQLNQFAYVNPLLTGHYNDLHNNSSSQVDEEEVPGTSTSFDVEPGSSGIRTNNLELNINGLSTVNGSNKKKPVNSRIKVNFDKKLVSTQNQDVSGLAVVPVSIGMQPIFVNQSGRESEQES